MAIMLRPGLEEVSVPISNEDGSPPAALRSRARFDGRDVWEIFVLDDASAWPVRAVYRLIDRMDDAGEPVGPWE